jgi:PST family polysaccharide transporter
MTQPAKALHRQAFLALSWSTVGTIVAFASNGVALVVLSRMIAPRAFGAMAAALAIGLLIRTVSLLALTQATIQSSDDRVVDTSTTAGWVLSAVFAGLLFAGAQPLADVCNFGHSAWLLRAWSLVLLCQGASVPGQAILARDLRFKELTAVQAVAAVVGSAIVPIVLAARGMELGALFNAVLAQAFIETAGTWIAVRRVFVPRRVTGVITLVRQTWDFALVYAGSAASNNADNLVTAAFLGSQSLGFYSRAYRLMSVPANAVGDAMDSVLYPVVLRSRDRPDDVRRGVDVATFLVALVVLPLSAVGIVLGHEVIAVILGSQWDASVTPFRILCIGLLFRIGIKPFAGALRGLGYQRRLSAVIGLLAVAVVVCTVVGQAWGITGVATGVVVALGLAYVTAAFVAGHALGASPWVWMGKAAAALPLAAVSALAAAAARAAMLEAPEAARLVGAGVAGGLPVALAFFLPAPRAAVRSVLRMRRRGTAPVEVPL